MAFLKRLPEHSLLPSQHHIPEQTEHKELCVRAARFLKSNGFTVSFDDRFRAWSTYGELPDAIGFRNGVSCLIEVKCSRSDFLADKKKSFRIDPHKGMGDWRFFLCQPGIIDVTELPDGWGLLYIKGRKIIKIHGWPTNSMWLIKKPFEGNKQAECDFLYSALRKLLSAGYTLT